jgi:hypothetical protein
MTSYITITDAETDPSAPLTSELAKKWRDNPIAITEGATGAPRIVGAAMFGTSAGTTVLRDCLPTGSRTASSSSAAIVTQVVESASATALVACEIQVLVTSSISGSGTARRIDIYKNGTVVQTYGAVTGATVSVSLAAGDDIGVNIVAQGTNDAVGSTTLSVLQYRVNTRSAVFA